MGFEQQIQELQDRYKFADKNLSATTSNLLEDVVSNVFDNPAQIGYELIQNADDASDTDGFSIEIDFFIFKTHILIRHNGAHFTAQDLDRLCRYGARETDKDPDSKQGNINKTGYKGIGFKSVFSISNCVHVFSDQYNFQFSKEHWGTHLPWQIMPIASDKAKLPEAIKPYIDTEKVCFLLELNNDSNRQIIKKRLSGILDNYKIILFLRHASKIELSYEYSNSRGIKLIKKLTRYEDDGIIYINEFDEKEYAKITRWNITNFNIKIPLDIRNSIQHLDKRICPDKLKNTDNLKLSFATKLKEDKTIIPLTSKEAYLFSFLPTGVQRNFPFVVNSNFILNASRTEIPNNTWNQFLFEQIGYYQFEWFRQMSGDPILKNEFPKLIIRYGKGARKLNWHLQYGVEKAQKEIAYISVMGSGELKKSNQTVVDKTKISIEEGEVSFVKDSYPEYGQLEIVDPEIKELDTLILLGVREFNISKLKDTIRKTRKFITPQDNARLILFFHRRINQLEKSDCNNWNKELVNIHFILNETNELRCPTEVYFPAKNELPEFSGLDIRFIHTEVHSELEKDKDLISWLKKLGTSHPTPAEIIRRGILKFLDEEKDTPSNIIPITRYIFNNRNSLSEVDYFKIKRTLRVLTTDTALIPIQKSYLPKIFTPRLNMEDWIKGAVIFVSEAYINYEGSIVEEWKNFFLRLGVKEDMNIELREEVYNRNQLNGKPYTEFIFEKNPSFNKMKGYSVANCLLEPLYIEYCANHDFAVNYWTIIFEEKWLDLKNKDSFSKFLQNNKKVHVDSYFKFLIETNSYFPATDGNCYKTTALYSNHLSLIIQRWAPTSYFESIDKNKEAFLGINTNLELGECLDILMEIKTTSIESIDKDRINHIYQYIVQERFAKTDLEDYTDTIELVATDNSFQNKDQFLYLDIPKFAHKNDSPRFIHLDLNKKDAEYFCDLFSIPIIRLDDLEVIVNDQAEIDSDFSSRWTSIVPYLALINSSKRGRIFQKELDRLIDLSEHINISCHDEIQLVYIEEGEILYKKEVRAWFDQKNIRFKFDWKEPETLFDLKAILSVAFELKDCENEIGLMLRLASNTALDWLEEQGYDIRLIEHKSTEQGSLLIATEDYTEYPTNSYDSINIRIGNSGEQFICQEKIIEQYYESKGIKCSVVWLNEKKEEKKPYDFVVFLDSEKEEKHYWEIKTTISSIKSDFPISSNEIKFMFSHPDNYFIIRVYSIYHTPNYKIHNELYKKFMAGEVELNQGKLFVY